MKLSFTIDVVYADNRVLVVSSCPGKPANVVDATVGDLDELDAALSLVTLSIRRQVLGEVSSGR